MAISTGLHLEFIGDIIARRRDAGSRWMICGGLGYCSIATEMRVKRRKTGRNLEERDTRNRNGKKGV